MYVVTVEFQVDADHVSAFRDAMLEQAKNSLALETGCRQFDVCFDEDDAARCFLYEKYDDRAAFDLHLESSHFKAFDEKVGPWLQSKTVQTWTCNHKTKET